MKLNKPQLFLGCLCALLASTALQALETDRQQPLEVNADSTDGTLGDGTATLQGNVEIQQGTLLIKADIAEVEKAEGRVRRFQFTGKPVHLQQEIEQEGLVVARANKIEYEVATGIVTLTGEADVVHPQYHISGEVLEYDMNVQHFKGSGSEESGRIHIRLDPEVVPDTDSGGGDSDNEDQGGDADSAVEEPSGDLD